VSNPKVKLRSIASAAVVLLALCAAVGGWVWQQRHRAGQPDPQTMVALRRLDQVWTSFPNRHSGKTEYGEASNALGAAISSCSAAELDGIIQYLGAQFTDAPTGPVRKDFDDGFLGTLLWLCLSDLRWARDRERLLYLLTRVPYYRFGFVSIETEFGYDFRPTYGEHDPFKPDELFFVLFDAYEDALTPGVRASTLAAIQRSFRDQPGDPETGAEYVAKCRAWFTDNFDRIEVKREHMDVYGDESWRDVPPLFVIRKAQ
jgi:hypothetical protein